MIFSLSKRLTRPALAAAALAGTLFLGTTQEAAPKGPEVGKAAPAFRLNTHEGKSIAFGGAADTWRILAFYPKAATPG